MALGLACVLVGALLIYAALTGRSVRQLLLGDNSTPAQPRSVTG